ncbi:MAG: zinc-ribbon domain-containing protein [Clostridia bacterium]|nr:zinc-ribbon domain-containing protein [Clostridia bacterium]
MAFCTKCGSKLDDNAAFCPNCGTAVGAEPVTQSTEEWSAPAVPPKTTYQAPQPTYQAPQHTYQAPDAPAPATGSVAAPLVLGILAMVFLITSSFGFFFVVLPEYRSYYYIIARLYTYSAIFLSTSIITLVLGAVAKGKASSYAAQGIRDGKITTGKIFGVFGLVCGIVLTVIWSIFFILLTIGAIAGSLI